MPAYKDHSGEVYGKWTLLSRIKNTRPAKYICRCICGNESAVFLTNIKRGLTTQCTKCQGSSKSSHMIGKRFNYLIVMALEKVNSITKAKIQCDCGNIRYLDPGRISSGIYKSCGKCILNKNEKIKETGVMNEGFSKGRLTILRKIDDKKSLAKCTCGNEKIVKYHHMKIKTPSCGCHIKENNKNKATKLEGTTFFRLKIMKFLRMGTDKRAIYLVKCKCGIKFERSITYLFGAKSCGCLQKDNICKGIRNHLSKLTDCEVISMREFDKSKTYSKHELAELYGITYSHVLSIINRKSWKHV